jgi:DNA-binding SARP family transcriptional activator/basic membrane lipoprotein Med (substrate-binding protein (PBP1-ABC) superfamily)
MDFRVLGSLEVSADGAVAELGPPKQRALLAILLLHVGEIVSVDRLIDLLWGEHPPRTATHSIQIYVSDLRKALEAIGGQRVVATRPPGYQLDADPGTIDALRFETLLAEGIRRIGDGDTAGGAATLRAALGLWRGPALSDFIYEEFAQPYIRRFHDLHLDAIEQLAAAELEAGRHAEAVPMLNAAIREDPLRERSRELLMLALYRSGRHPEALRTYQQLRSLLADELGLDPSPALQRLQERVLLHDQSLLAQPKATPASAPPRNPYKGLRPFGESDTPDFFGRDDLTDRLVASLRAGLRLVALVGPSGSGKSSVIAAGLIPRLRAGAIPGSTDWSIVQMVPGANPLGEIESLVSLAADAPNGLFKVLDPDGTDGEAVTSLTGMPEGARLLLVIDQFEELFTLADEQPRREFLAFIARAVNEPESQISVLVALRADYYDRPLLYPDFAKVFTPGVVNALPMTSAELESAVIGPAERAGVSVEPGLVAALVADAADRPGTLPLLEFALTELFDQRTSPSLTLPGYRSFGGIRGVLSRSAEAIYAALGAGEREVAMQVLLRLVQLGHGTTESRRRLPVAELLNFNLDPVALSTVLDAFGSRRLLTFDRDATTEQATVEVAHESLFREWDRLAGWIDRHRTALQRYESLTAAADQWEAAGKNPDYLLVGTRLAEFEAWSQEGILQIGGRLKEFLTACLERRSALDAAERLRAEAERRLQRRARIRLFALAGAMVLLVGGSGLAIWAGLFNRTPHVAFMHSGSGHVDAIGEDGFDRAVSEFGLIGEESLYVSRFPDGGLAELKDLSDAGVGLIYVADAMWNAEPIVEAHPEIRYVFGFEIERLPNVAATIYAEQEGAYLAGVAAALTSKTGRIGFIGGHDSYLIWKWHAGFQAGARSVNPDIQVLSAYIPGEDFQGFADPARAEVEARRMYGAGADVILHAAGDSGVGVFEAAADLSTPDRQLWAIGADSDQYETVTSLSGAVHADLWQRHILTSAIKRVDIAVYETIASFARGEFRPGPRVFDLVSQAIDISYSGGYLREIQPQIEAARARIISGQVVVPCVPPERFDAVRASGFEPEDCAR